MAFGVKGGDLPGVGGVVFKADFVAGAAAGVDRCPLTVGWLGEGVVVGVGGGPTESGMT